MLIESLLWLTARCSQPARRLGYLRESIAIAARYRRCRAAWQPHLDKTRDALLASAQRCRPRRVALVFGSGLLLDIPLAELSALFEEVRLVDMVHMPAVRRAARRFPNVTLVEHDVSELLAPLLAEAAGLDETRLRVLAERIPARFLNDDRVDWVASVNLLSQLALLPAQWLRARVAMPPAFWPEWEWRLMQRHLDYLAAFRADACLVADAIQVECGGSGAETGRRDYGQALGLADKAFDTWRWQVAPPGELAGGGSAWHQVVACRWGDKR